jgi:hypothetical protein
MPTNEFFFVRQSRSRTVSALSNVSDSSMDISVMSNASDSSLNITGRNRGRPKKSAPPSHGYGRPPNDPNEEHASNAVWPSSKKKRLKEQLSCRYPTGYPTASFLQDLQADHEIHVRAKCEDS